MKLPAFFSALFFILGIWTGRNLALPDELLFTLAVIFFVAGVVIYLKKLYRYGWLIVAAALLVGGIFRINLDLADLPNNDLSHFNDLGRRVEVVGEIVREPDLRPDRTYLTVSADTLIYDRTRIPVSGLLIVKLKYSTSDYNLADYVNLRGYLSTPLSARNPGAFDYRKYLLTKKVRSYMSIKLKTDVNLIRQQSGNLLLTEIVIPLRKYMLDVFDKHLNNPQSALIGGFLIGETRFIPREIYENFRDTGTLHLLAVSGSNVALVVGTVAFLLLLIRVPLRIRYIISFLVILLFCHLSYNQPSVIRASVMISLYILGRLAYRKPNYVSIISVASLLILMFDPLMLWSVGFQLSFAAAFGLIYFIPIIYKRVPQKKGRFSMVPNFFVITFFSSLVAQAAVAPILAYNFNTIPLVGFIANLVVVPLSSLTVIGSLVLAVLGWFQPLAGLVGMIADLLLRFTIWSVEFFASLPMIRLDLAAPDWSLIAVYYVILVLVFETIRNIKNLRYLVLSLLVFANLFVWRGFVEQLDQSARVTVLDVSSNQAIHVETAAGINYLAGEIEPKPVFDPAERILIPYCIDNGIRDIARLVAFDGNSPGHIRNVLTGNGIAIDNYRRQRESMTAENTACKDEKITLFQQLGDASVFAVMFQTDSLTLLICESVNYLDGEENDNVLAKLKHASILVAPEPELISSKVIALIRRIDPQAIVFSSYSYLFNEPPGYSKLKQIAVQEGIRLFSTRENGAVEIIIRDEDFVVKPMIVSD